MRSALALGRAGALWLWRRFGRRVAGLWRNSADAVWRQAVASIGARLEDFNHATERDFLAVGGRLAGVQQTVRRLSSGLAGLTALVSDEHGLRAIESLHRMQSHAEGIHSVLAQRNLALTEVRRLSREVRGAFADVRGTVTTFRGLCSLIRIETARLAGAGGGFVDLAEAVTGLSERIQARGEEIFEALGLLDGSIQLALRSGSELREQQIRQLPSLLAAVVDGLACFQERQRQAHELSLAHQAHNQEISDAIERLVLSVQTHDITRQQIEHVATVLNELSTATCAADSGRLPRHARATLALQSSQLASAGRQFADAVAGIEASLANIASRIRERARESQMLMGGSGGEHNSFFLRVEGYFTAILRALDRCRAAEKEMRSRSSRLEESISGMRQAVEEIRRIAMEIQQIGLNAVIQAAHIGVEGSSLDVIAAAMHRLAVDSSANTERVAGLLAEIADAVAGLCGTAGPQSGDDAEKNEQCEEARRAILDVHATSEAAFSRVHEIAALAASLTGEIEPAALPCGRLVAETVAQACGQMDRLAALETGGAEEHRAENGGRLDALTHHYTMQREREVHRQMIEGEDAVAVAETAAADRHAGGEEFGDNVELF